MSTVNAKAGEYSADVTSRFRESDGKLFLVDYSKSAALGLLKKLSAECGKPSLLFIVKDAGLAKQFKELMEADFPKIATISSTKEIKELLGEAREPAALRSVAPGIKEKYKYLIVSAFSEEGKAVLNWEICRDDGKSGNFAGNDKASAYTFSDVLTEAGYEFVAIDSVFDYLRFVSDDAEHKAGEEELIDFLGKIYYTDTAHSYRRLNNLVDNGKYALIMADEMTDTDAVSFYAVCELIRSDFSLLEVRRKVKQHTMDYSSLCDLINSNVLGASRDPDIVSGCLQRTRGFSNVVPNDLESMSDYLPRALEFISMEETALKVVNYLVNHRGRGDFSRVDDVAESFGQDYNEIAECFVDIFFKNEFKAEIEKSVKHVKVADMERPEISAMFSMLLKYGLYHWHTPLQNKPTLLRLFRESSGFEYIVRRLGRKEYDAKDVRTILGGGSERLYKCAEIQRLLTGAEEELAMQTPMLLVLRDGGRKIADCLRKLLPDLKVHTKDYKLDAGTINVIDYETLRESPMEFNVKSVVYFELCYDVALMKLIISRLATYGAPKQCILASGDTLDGLCADAFDELLVSDIESLPILAPKVTIKTGLDIPYSEIVQNLNVVYESLQNAVEKGHPDIIDDVATSYNHILAEYTNYSSVPEDEIHMDIEFIARIGKFFSAIFANTVTVGECGECVASVSREFEPVSKKGEAPREKVKEDVERDFFFNVCTKALMHVCDLRERNCGGCGNYSAHTANRYEEMIDNIDAFFRESYSYLKKMERFRTELQMEATINAGGIDEEESELDATHLKEYEAIVRSAVDMIKVEDSQKKSFFVTDYEPIETIREHIYRPYRRMLRKYYKTVMELMQTASEKANAELHNALDCTPSVES